MVNRTVNDGSFGMLSAERIKELKAIFKSEFGKELTDAEAHDAGIKIAQFVYVKEMSKMRDEQNQAETKKVNKS